MGLRIAYDFDDWLDGTVTSSSEKGDNTDGRATSLKVGEKWRTTSNTLEWWKNDLGSAKNLKMIGLSNFNLTAAATVEIEAHTSSDFSSPSFTQVVPIATDADGVVQKRAATYFDETYQYWRLTIDDPGNSKNYVEFGVIRAAGYYDTVREINTRFRIETLDASQVEGDEGESPNVRDVEEEFRRARVGFTLMPNADRRQLDAIFTKVGRRKPCFIDIDPDNTPEHLMYGHWITSWDREHASILTYWTAQAMIFEEKTR